MKIFALVLLVAACGPGAAGGPNVSTRFNEDPDSDPEIQSNDILAREPTTNRSQVKHILVSWAGMGKVYKGNQDARGKARSREQADQLATSLLARVRAGEDMDQLMREFSEDGGSAQSGTSYEVKPDAALVFEFRRLGLRLKVGEAGLVKSVYGWHIMKRVE
jgi:peptidyl-prolyl cis-trans isomerase D